MLTCLANRTAKKGGRMENDPRTVDADAFIDAAISLGARDGIAALDPDQRLVFLISEAEVDYDMNGIETCLNRYCPLWIAEIADAFAAVGATEIAMCLRAITSDTRREDPVLDRVNELITERSGYDYETIRKEIERRLAKRSDSSGSCAVRVGCRPAGTARLGANGRDGWNRLNRALDQRLPSGPKHRSQAAGRLLGR
jgi:hypothetical protein